MQNELILFDRCQTIGDALRIRKRYNVLPDNVSLLMVDMGMLDRLKPEVLLLGVLLNMRRFFDKDVEIQLCDYPNYLPSFLRVCKLNNNFTLVSSDS